MEDFETPPQASGAPRKSGLNPGCFVGFVALAIAIAPIVLGLLGSITCPQPANEGNCAAAAAPWLLFFTLPFGFILGIISIVIYFIEARKRKIK
jgi:hypothetical protein